MQRLAETRKIIREKQVTTRDGSVPTQADSRYLTEDSVSDELIIESSNLRSSADGFSGDHQISTDSVVNVESWSNARSFAADAEEMEKCSSDLLALHIRLFGRDDPSTLRQMEVVAGIAVELGRYREARALLEEVVRTKMEKLPRNDPSLLTSVWNLANHLDDVGAVQEALTLRKDIYENVDESNEVFALSAGAALGASLYRVGEYHQALQMQLNVLSARQLLLGATDPITLESMESVAQAYKAMSDLQEAQEIEESLVRSWKRKFWGPMMTERCEALSNLAVTYKSMDMLS